MPRKLARVRIAVVFLGLALTAFAAVKFVSYAQKKAAPNATAAASITDTVAFAPGGDVNTNGKANPGDKLEGTITASATGTADLATKVTIPISSLLTLDNTFGTNGVQVSPIAAPDTYAATGNIQISQPTGSGSLLANDIDPVTGNNTGLVATAVTISSANCTGPCSGNVTISANGSFTYISPPNFTGADSFTYTATSASGGTTTGTATVNVSDRVIFVSSIGVGNCRQATPCSLATADALAVPTVGKDLVYVLSGTYSTATFSMSASQNLIGQGVGSTQALSDAGITLAANSTDPSVVASTNPIFNNAATTLALSTNDLVERLALNPSAGSAIVGTSITSGADNINNISIGATGAANGINLTTNTGGTFNFSTIAVTTATGTGLVATVGGTVNVAVSGSTINAVSGQGINANGVTLAATFTSVSAGGGANGIGLTTVTGTSSFGSGTLTGATSSEFLVSGSNPSVTYSGAITQNNAQRVVDVQGTTANGVTLSGTITGGTSSLGVHIGDTTAVNGNVTFTTLNLGASTNACSTRMTGQAVTITGGAGTYGLGTVNICTNTGGGGLVATNADGTINITNGTIDSTNAPAVNITGPAGITSLGVTLAKVSSTSTAVGLNLQNTNGSFTVTGDVGSTVNASGGTFQTMSASAIQLSNVQNISFDQVNIQGTTRSGINGTSVTNFSFTNGTIGTTNAVGTTNLDACIAFNTTVFGGAQTQNGNNINGTLTLTGSTLSNCFAAGLDIQSDNGTISNATVSNNTVSNIGTGTSGISFSGTGAASTSFNLTKATINLNNFTNVNSAIQVTGSNSTSGPGVTMGIPNDASNIISITNNGASLKAAGTNAIIVSVFGANTASRSRSNFLIQGNGKTVASGGTAPAALGSSSIGTVILVGNNGFTDMTGTVDSNVVTATHTPGGGGGNGIAGGNGVAGGSAWTPVLTLTVTNNTITGTDGNGILLVSRTSNTGATHGIANLKIASNNITAPVNAGGTARQGIRVDAGNAVSVDDEVYLNLNGNTSAGSNGAAGLGVRKQGIVQTTNDFGIFDAPGGNTLAGCPNPTNANVMTFLAAQNPAGNNVDIISGSNYECDTTKAPAFADMGGDDLINSPAPPANYTLPRSAYDEEFRKSMDEEIDIPVLHPRTSGEMSVLAPRPTQLQSRSMPFSDLVAATFVTPMTAQDIFGPMIGTTAPEKTGDEFAANAPTNALGDGVSAEALAVPRQATTEGESSLIAELYNKLTSAIEPTAYAQETITDSPTATVTVDGGGAGFTIPAGSSVTIKYRATVNTPAAGTGFASGIDTIDNQASAVGSNFATINSTTASIALDAAPDLSMVIDDGGATTTQPGVTINYTVSYGNGFGSVANNLQDASGAILTVPLPTGTSYNSTVTPGWTCVAGSCTKTITGPITVNTGSRATTNFAVDVPQLPLATATTVAVAGSTIGETTAVHDNGPDLNSANNTAPADTDNIIGIWTGNTSNVFGLNTNWSNSVLPDIVTGQNIAIVTGGGANAPTLAAGNAVVNNIFFATATPKNLTITSPSTLTVKTTASLGAASVVGTGTLIIDNGATITRTTGQVNCPLQKNFFSGAIPPPADGTADVNAPEAPDAVFTFPVGTGTGYFPVDVTPTGGSTGSLTIQTFNGTAGVVPPLDNTKTLQRYWTVSGGAGITASIKFNYGPINVPSGTTINGNEANYKPQRVTGGVPTSFFDNCPAGTCVDQTNHFIFMPVVSNGSFAGNWTASEIAPTAASVAVAGRVLTADGQVIRGVRITLDDGTGHAMTAMSNAFGYYRFDEVRSGGTYIMNATARGYTFTPRVMSVNDELTDVNLTALP